MPKSNSYIRNAFHATLEILDSILALKSICCQKEKEGREKNENFLMLLALSAVTTTCASTRRYSYAE